MMWLWWWWRWPTNIQVPWTFSEHKPPFEDQQIWAGVDPRSLNCGITAFEMLGRFGLGGQVWPDMHNSNQKSSNCNKEAAPKTCHFKQTICGLQKNSILTADVWFCSGCDIGQWSKVALPVKKSLCMLKIYEWIITRIWDQPGMQPMYAMSKVLAWL